MHELLERPREMERRSVASVDPGATTRARRPFLAPLLRVVLVLALVWVGGSELYQGQPLRAGICLLTVAMVLTCLVAPGRWRR